MPDITGQFAISAAQNAQLETLGKNLGQAAVTDVVVANAIASVGVPTKVEFDAVVAVANSNKAQLNLALARLRTAGIIV